jgi:hypothetical protein
MWFSGFCLSCAMAYRYPAECPVSHRSRENGAGRSRRGRRLPAARPRVGWERIQLQSDGVGDHTHLRKIALSPLNANFGYDGPVTPRERRTDIVRALVGLRRVGRQHPADADLAVARLLLEVEIGPAVSRRFAADVLGVSETAVRRWVDRGDIPVVYTESGRLQIPVPALLDLYESVTAAKASGRGHVLEPVALAAQQRADALPPDLLSDIKVHDDMQHRQPRLRSLAYHRVLSQRLNAQMLADARQVLTGWEIERRIAPLYAEQWKELLTKPVAEIRHAIGADTEYMADLRQSSPFAGMLSERERRAALAMVAMTS